MTGYRKHYGQRSISRGEDRAMDEQHPNPSELPSVTTQERLEPPLTPEQVFRDYAGRVFHLARRMLGNDQDAEDVTQDVLLQVVRKLATFRGESSFTTWLHRITVNAALAQRRKQAQRPEHHI